MEPLPPIPSAAGSLRRRFGWPLVHLLVFSGVCWLITVIWRHVQDPASFAGQVEVVQVSVSSRDAGLLTNLWVRPLQEIQMGDLVAEVVTTDPRTVNNRLEAMRDRMRLISLELDPVLRRERSALAYEQLSVDNDRVKAELKIARVRGEQAKTQYERDVQLNKSKLLSDAELDISRRNRDAYLVEVEEKSILVERTEKTLERLKSMADTFVPGGENDPIKQALSLEEDKMRVFEAKLAPWPLFAPTNGVVTAILHHAGEQVQAGESIVTITRTNSGRIIGYLPQTVQAEPRVGMEVEVRLRTQPRACARARIIGVSPHFQPMTNTMIAPARVRPLLVPPIGRLISISLPPELPLTPGEPVDLLLLKTEPEK
jgi:multidrug resistance efflux pump